MANSSMRASVPIVMKETDNNDNENIIGPYVCLFILFFILSQLIFK